MAPRAPASEGAPLVAISGPAGAGKTALIEQLILRLIALGTEVAVIVCGPSAAAQAEELRRSGLIAPERVVDIAHGGDAGDLAARIPGVELILVEHAGDPPADRFAFRVRVVEAASLRGLGARAPVLPPGCDLLVANKDALSGGVEDEPRRGATTLVRTNCITGVGVDRVLDIIARALRIGRPGAKRVHAP